MKVHFDEKADAVYLRLDDSPIIGSEEVSPGVVLDYNEKNDVVGVEILRVKGRIRPESLNQIQLEVVRGQEQP
ncbi:MAG: DUF2283 domain-containing protein [Deltaproteobacteria bacterium]|nr:DUF2283 domain-containing protein [Deltaproteobacteria bacterium]